MAINHLLKIKRLKLLVLFQKSVQVFTNCHKYKISQKKGLVGEKQIIIGILVDNIIHCINKHNLILIHYIINQNLLNTNRVSSIVSI